MLDVRKVKDFRNVSLHRNSEELWTTADGWTLSLLRTMVVYIRARYVQYGGRVKRDDGIIFIIEGAIYENPTRLPA
jgi:hypothetical protein